MGARPHPRAVGQFMGLGLSDDNRIPPSGVVPVPYRLGTIPSGDAGVRVTLDVMVQIVLEYRMSPQVRMWAQELAGACANRERFCQVEVLHGYVRDRIKYLPDVRDVETIQTPDYTLSLGSGDCDDQATLLACALESIGFATRFCAIGRGGGGFSHVSSQVRIGRGWLNLETILPALPAPWGEYAAGAPVPVGWFPPDVTRVRLAHV
jgi:transglutaminase-like putative cysteine protease